MDALSPDALLARMRWRYAVKKFDPQRRIAPDAWSALEDSLVLAPSSFGLQPWKFVVVEDPALRGELLLASWNQRQIADASHVVVFAAVKDVGAAHVDAHLRRAAQVRGVEVESLAGMRRTILRFIERKPPEFDVNAWAALQVYIALGTFMTAAAAMGIDTCPMEGIVPAKYDALLGLPARGLATTVVCCAGYRAADDALASLPKVRFPAEDVILRI
jgi:nitroreductase